MVPNRDVHLIPANLAALRPTQMTVGYREVTLKREHWKTLNKKQRSAAIDSHSFPAVLGRRSFTTSSTIITSDGRCSKRASRK
jgi:hypothetical protein